MASVQLQITTRLQATSHSLHFINTSSSSNSLCRGFEARWNEDEAKAKFYGIEAMHSMHIAKFVLKCFTSVLCNCRFIFMYTIRHLLLRVKVKGLKVIYRHLQGNPNSTSLQFKVAYWAALALGSMAQLAAGSPLPEWTDFGPTVAARHHLWPSQLHYGLHHTIFSGIDFTVLLASISRY